MLRNRIRMRWAISVSMVIVLSGTSTVRAQAGHGMAGVNPNGRSMNMMRMPPPSQPGAVMPNNLPGAGVPVVMQGFNQMGLNSLQYFNMVRGLPNQSFINPVNPLSGLSTPVGGTSLTGSTIYPSNPGFLPGGTGSPYGGTGPYSNGTSNGNNGYGSSYSYSDPSRGYLGGAADVTNAQNHVMASYQQAKLLGQEVERQRVENRKRFLQEGKYEQEHASNAEDQRARIESLGLSRSLNDPPLNEVLSGGSLNTLLNYLEKHPDPAGQAISLDEQMLKLVHVAAPQGGSLGLLQNSPRLRWPEAFQAEQFREKREGFDQMLVEATGQAKQGKVDAARTEEMRDCLGAMRRQLSSNLKDLTSAQSIEARRFLKDLDEAIRALDRSGTHAFPERERIAQGKTVAELVRNMEASGLRFMPAVIGRGESSAYLRLHTAMAQYTLAILGDHSRVAEETQTGREEVTGKYP